MMFFIHHVQTYSNVNKKGREMCEFAKAFDRLLITDQCALDSLKCSFETKVNELNQKYPKTKAITFSAGVFDSQDGQFSVRVGNDDNQSVCFISYASVRGYYSFGEGMLKTQTLVTPGVCRICGCTEMIHAFIPIMEPVGGPMSLRPSVPIVRIRRYQLILPLSIALIRKEVSNDYQ